MDRPARSHDLMFHGPSGLWRLARQPPGRTAIGAVLSEAAAWVEAAVRVEAAAGPGAEAAAAIEDAEGATALTTDCEHLCDTWMYIPSYFFIVNRKNYKKTAGLRAINKYIYIYNFI